MRRRKSHIWRQEGQAVAEYDLLISIVVAAFATMQRYLNRRIQGAVKIAADQMYLHEVSQGVFAFNAELTQAEGMRYESGDRGTPPWAPGEILVRETASAESSARTVRHQELGGGARQTEIISDVKGSMGDLRARGAGVLSYSEVSNGAKN